MIKVTSLGFWMDGYLRSNLNSIIYNMKQDYDTLGLISGSGMVRVGKSVIAQQAGFYCAEKLGTKFGVENIVFSGKELMAAARRLPKNSVIIYDEARAELNVRRVMENITKSLLDFFAECGMYNHLLLMVCPDFFELPKSVATSRSEFLINVKRVGVQKKDTEGEEVVSFERGRFEFYNRRGKKMLYIVGKKAFDDYDVGMKYRSFDGNFTNTWIVDRKAYEEKKLKHLQRERGSVYQDLRLAIALKTLCNHISQHQAVIELKEQGMEVSQGRISQLISQVSKIEPK
jgi:hypothetical protein